MIMLIFSLYCHPHGLDVGCLGSTVAEVAGLGKLHHQAAEELLVGSTFRMAFTVSL